jgi:hypothetical protein
MSNQNIPQRDSTTKPSPRVQAAAARLLVRANHEAKRATPDYIVKLAQTATK